jgi:hypothetical protein
MHDAKGRELKIGDTVLIPAKVKEVHVTEDYCDVSLESRFRRRPDGFKEHFNAINSGVTLRCNPGDENDLTGFPA